MLTAILIAIVAASWSLCAAILLFEARTRIRLWRWHRAQRQSRGLPPATARQLRAARRASRHELPSALTDYEDE